MKRSRFTLNLWSCAASEASSRVQNHWNFPWMRGAAKTAGPAVSGAPSQSGDRERAAKSATAHVEYLRPQRVAP